jgi:hypothetical protein
MWPYETMGSRNWIMSLMNASTEIVLTFHQETRDGSTWRLATLRLLPENEIIATPYIEFIDEPDLPLPTTMDGFVLLLLFFCMVRGGRLIVEGAVSPSLVRSLRYLQRAWIRFSPKRFKMVEIVPLAFAEVPTADDKAISAFSGGIDSIFLALQHGSTALGNTRYPLTDVMFAHGLDIPIEARSTFSTAVERSRKFLDSLSLRPRLVRTNVRQMGLPYWGQSHGTVIGGLLHQFSHEFAYGLIGSTNSYEHLRLYVGSNPTLDHLMSSKSFSIVHDGAEYRRIEKVKKIAENAIATESARVCWEGSDLSRNCGVCEKCVHTHLAFLAIGNAKPACFDGPLDPGFTELMHASGPDRLRYYEYFLEASKGRDDEAWRIALEKRLHVLRTKLAWQSVTSDLTNAFRYLIKR